MQKNRLSESFLKLTEIIRHGFNKGLIKQYLAIRSMKGFVLHLGYI